MRLTLITLLLLSGFCVKAETPEELDSLRVIALKSKVDTSKIWALLKLGEQIYRSKPDTAMMYWETALELTLEKLEQSLE
ncbi:MAG: hypothetical protein COB85_07295, partial [Bacteroidetes bacterium]